MRLGKQLNKEEHTTMKTVKIGFIGCGRMGKLHMANLINSVPNAEVIAVADPYIETNGGREWCM